MKYFQILLLLGINYSTILLSQSIEIPHKMMKQYATLNIPIFIYDVSNLESIQLKIEYDESIVLAEEIIENPAGILDGGYTFTTNFSEPGIIQLAIGSNSANIFSGSGMIAQIPLQAVGQLGDFSDITFLDAQINSDWQISVVDGSIELILDELTITGQDDSGIGANHVITLGMCDGCTDEWKFGEDEDDYPDPTSGEYTNINFYQLDWFGQEDENGNVCNQIEFSTNFRSQHSIRELTSWGIKGSTGGGLSSDIDIKLSWDSDILNSASDNFQIFIYVGDTGYNMQVINNINVSQSDLTLNENNDPNIWVKMGGCADTGETSIYYRDFDNDGFGSCTLDILDEFENCLSCEEDPDCVYFCEGLQPAGWVSNHTDLNDDLFCLSNNIDDCDVCDGLNGDKDCSGECFGTATEDSCAVCDGNDDCVDCNGVAYGGTIHDCNNDCGGDAYIDNCEDCVGGYTGDLSCEMDCNGAWGGAAFEDVCGVCEGDGTDTSQCTTECPNGQDLGCDNLCYPDGTQPIKDECGICDSDSSNDCVQDCNNVWGGTAYEDNCDVCDNDSSNDCEQDCNNVWGGTAYEDNCDVCDNDSSNDCEQDCNGDWDGSAVLDNCGTCDTDTSNDCEFDCNDKWGGGASYDNCQICAGGLTGLIPCEQDCNGDWGGHAFTDDCGVCDSDNNNNNQCFDCNFVPNGGAIIDNCDECILPEEVSSCVLGCDGNWDSIGFTKKYDECGVCGGINTSCLDCSGIINGESWLDACEECVLINDTSCPIDCAGDPSGTNQIDNCGICDTDASNDCMLDCNGIWGGQAKIDGHCETCIEGTTGLEACILDCNGIWGGIFKKDLCEICDADTENDNQCVDCNGTVDGLAELDNCGNCVEDLSDSSYECEPDCDGVWGGNHPPTFACENGDIACNKNACFLANDDFLLPHKFDINRIYPNPFNPQATINFEVSKPTMVQLNIYNLNGQTVEVLINEFILPGYYSVIWNGTNHPSGIYFVILQSSNSIVKQKMMLIK